MTKIKDWETANKKAKKEKTGLGFCVTDGYFYVGPVSELKKLPVIIQKVYG
jgi:hypothetical protein